MGEPLVLTMTCGPYDRAKALIDGSVQAEGIELRISVNDDDIDRQRRAAAGEFDIAEFFTGTYIADLPFKKLGFTAIPIFVKRMFRHSYIYVNRKSGIRTPSDLNGKRVGVQTWITSAALWAKGMLADDYGVDLASIDWVAAYAVRIPDWKKPSWLRLETSPADVDQLDLLARGDIDCAITTEIWAPDVHPDIGYLFPDYLQQERNYFQRTRCYPIMHTLIVRNAVLEAHPWVAMSLFKAWEASKAACYEWNEWLRIHSTTHGYRAIWEEEHRVFGPDPYVWGYARTKHELERFLRYAYEQGATPTLYRPEQLFHESTLET